MLDIEVSWGTLDGRQDLFAVDSHIVYLCKASLMQSILQAKEPKTRAVHPVRMILRVLLLIVCVDGGSVRILERGTASYCVALMLCRLSRS